MSEFIKFQGVCPTQNKTGQITVFYLSASTLSEGTTNVKHKFLCEYAQHNGCNNISNCPVFMGAPQNI